MSDKEELTELTGKMRKLVTDWIEVGGDVTGESFDRWLGCVRAEAAAEQREKDALLAEDTYKGWDKSNLSYEDAAAWSEADGIAAAIRGFTPMEGTKQ